MLRRSALLLPLLALPAMAGTPGNRLRLEAVVVRVDAPPRDSVPDLRVLRLPLREVVRDLAGGPSARIVSREALLLGEGVDEAVSWGPSAREPGLDPALVADRDFRAFVVRFRSLPGGAVWLSTLVNANAALFPELRLDSWTRGEAVDPFGLVSVTVPDRAPARGAPRGYDVVLLALDGFEDGEEPS